MRAARPTTARPSPRSDAAGPLAEGRLGAVGCARCGRRQSDPASGPSDWRRGVLRGDQVLVCPECTAGGALELLDRCAACGSTALVKRLGEVACRACGAVDATVEGAGYGVPGGADRAELAADVAAALDRVLGPDPGSASGSAG